MKTKKTKSKKIQYGNADLPDNAFEDKNVKIRISMMIGMDVLKGLKKTAEERGLPYQTYINLILRENVFGRKEEAWVRNIVRDELAKKVG